MKTLLVLSHPTCWMNSYVPRTPLMCKDHVDTYSRFFYSPSQPRRTRTFGVVRWSSMDSVHIEGDGDGAPSEEEKAAVQRILLTMPVIDIKLELQDRGVEHQDEFEKLGLVKRLARARIESKKRHTLECTPYSDEYSAKILESKEMGAEVTTSRLQEIGANFSRSLDDGDPAAKCTDACLAVRSTALPTEQALGNSEPAKEALQRHGTMLSTRELLDFLEIMGNPHSPLDSREELVRSYVTCCMRENGGDNAALTGLSPPTQSFRNVETHHPFSWEVPQRNTVRNAPFQKLSGQQSVTPPRPSSRVSSTSNGPALFASYDAALSWSSHLPFDDLSEELDHRGLSVSSDPGEEGPIAWSKQAAKALAEAVMIEKRLVNRNRQSNRKGGSDTKGAGKKYPNSHGRGRRTRGDGDIVDKRLDFSLETTASEAFANAASAVQTVVTSWAHPERNDDDEQSMGLREIRRVLGNTVSSSSTRAVLGILGSTATACVHSVEAVAEWAGGRLINREHIILGVCLFSLALRRGLWSTLLLILAVRTVRITTERMISVSPGRAGSVSPTRKKKKVFVKKRRKDWMPPSCNYNDIAVPSELVQ